MFSASYEYAWPKIVLTLPAGSYAALAIRLAELRACGAVAVRVVLILSRNAVDRCLNQPVDVIVGKRVVADLDHVAGAVVLECNAAIPVHLQRNRIAARALTGRCHRC